MKEKNKVIVLGNDHTNTIGVVQCLGKEGFYVIAVLWGEKTELIKSSNYTKKILSAHTPQECINLILSECVEEKKIPIIPCCDTASSYLINNKDQLSKHFLFLTINNNFCIDELLDKSKQVEIAKECGFNIPKSWEIERFNDIPTDIIYPCLIKPLVSMNGKKSDMHVCKTEDSLKKYLKEVLPVTPKLLIQQYIEKDFDYVVLGCGLKNGEVIVPALIKKHKIFPLYTGLETVVSVKPLTDSSIKESIKRMINRIGLACVFSIEFVHSTIDDKLYFVELNPRNDGINPAVVRAGINLPLIHVNDLTNCPLSANLTVKPVQITWEMHHLLSMLHRQTPIKEWIKDLKDSDGFLIYDSKDKKPFFKQFTNFFLQKIHLKKPQKY